MKMTHISLILCFKTIYSAMTIYVAIWQCKSSVAAEDLTWQL